jgi:hypothetical protein
MPGRPGAAATAKLYPSRVHQTFTSAQLADVDAIKTAIATAATIQTYTGAAINGALAISNVAYMRLPQAVSMTASSAASQYTALSLVVFTGTAWDGSALTESLTVTDANGGWTVVGNEGFRTVTQVLVAAQAATGGQWEFGVRDVLMPSASPIRQIRHGSDGDILVGFEGDDNAAPNTTLYRDTVTGLEGERHDGLYRRVFGTAATTSSPVTIYI